LWVVRFEQVASDGGRLGTIYFFLRLNQTTQPDTLSTACEAGNPKNITTFVATVHAPAMRLQPGADGSADGSWGGCYDGFRGRITLPSQPEYDFSGTGTPPYDNTNIQLLAGQVCSGERGARPWHAADRYGCWTMWEIHDADFSNVDHRDSHIDIHIVEESGNDWTLVRRAPNLPDSIHVTANSTVTWQDLRDDTGTDQFDAFYFPVIGQTHVFADCAITATTPGQVGLVIAGTDSANANSFQCVDGWSRTGP
jgi:hypothetical protein